MSTRAASTRSATAKSAKSTSAADPQNVTADKANDVAAPPAETSIQQNGDGDQQPPPTEPEGGYPEQKHAGAVGYGPEYGKNHRATTTDKVVGLKDEVVGKIMKNPQKVQHGKEQKSGELKRKQAEEQDNDGPFAKNNDPETKDEGGGDKKKTKTDDDAPATETRGEDEQPDKMEVDGEVPTTSAATTSVTGKLGRGVHRTDSGAREQAATTAPEGTEEAEAQRRGENTDADKQIDEKQSVLTTS